MKAYSASIFHGLHVRNTHGAAPSGFFPAPLASYWPADVSGSRLAANPGGSVRLLSRTETTLFALCLAAHLCGRDLSRWVGVARNPYISYTATRARARSPWDRGVPPSKRPSFWGFRDGTAMSAKGVRPLGSISGSVHSRTPQRAHARRPLGGGHPALEMPVLLWGAPDGAGLPSQRVRPLGSISGSAHIRTPQRAHARR